MRSALGCAALGLLLLLVAGTFDAEPLYVTGSALLLLGAGAAGWIWFGALGASIKRELSARSVLEEQPLEVRIRATGGRLPLPPGRGGQPGGAAPARPGGRPPPPRGWSGEPLLPEPVRFRAGRRVARVRVEVT